MRFTKAEKIFTLIFLIIVLLELLSESALEILSVRFLPKPLILLSLIIFFLTQSKHLTSTTKLFMTLGLTFSLTGDILLMFVDASSNYFIGGLIAFLIAHIMYVKVFLDKRNKDNSILGILVVLLIYALGIFYLLRDGLGDMLIPVILYMLIILSMAITAWLRKGAVSKLSHLLLLIGALLFVMSDSTLALNKFYQTVPQSHIIIMSTYALAQYCIVLGVLRQNESF